MFFPFQTGLFGYWALLSRGGRDYAAVTTIDRDVLILPDILVDDYNTPIPSVLRPAFDALWQAAGFARSMNYDQQGQWLP